MVHAVFTDMHALLPIWLAIRIIIRTDSPMVISGNVARAVALAGRPMEIIWAVTAIGLCTVRRLMRH